MALKFPTALRTSRVNLIKDRVDGGAGAALIRIYSGTQPADANTALSGNTLLAELPCSDPCGTESNGVLTFSAITTDSSANATGTATFFRVVQSDGTTVAFDGTVGTSGTDLVVATTSIVATQPVQITSWVITEGGA